MVARRGEGVVALGGGRGWVGGDLDLTGFDLRKWLATYVAFPTICERLAVLVAVATVQAVTDAVLSTEGHVQSLPTISRSIETTKISGQGLTVCVCCVCVVCVCVWVWK